MPATKRKFWIFFYIAECVLCNKKRENRVRHYNTHKPKDPSKRYAYTQYACCNHF